ncbi:neuronal-specific septin-3 isoform X3 [Talpa occidentalis]|uniref:neuronal-specific septin-3 isoform X3 n=1 Tax=Talpa occidentalis TaxID=50954 RepID=UPI0023F82302|nr:neuronal-specific septin-3 isoform X3 [Talpa occidentalis]
MELSLERGRSQQRGREPHCRPSTAGLFPTHTQGKRNPQMEHDFEMQPHRAPSPGPSSRSHQLGCPARSSKLPGGVCTLTPVLRKTIRLDSFPQSHIPQASGRPGFGARAHSVPLHEPGDNPAPRKLSSISLTLRQNSQAWSLRPSPSPWGEFPTLGQEAAIHGKGRLPTAGSSSVTLMPGSRVHSEGPGSPHLAKPSRTPLAEKPLVSSYLTLPFQSRLTQGPPGPPGRGSAGQRHPVPATDHVPARASPGRGRNRSRGLPRSRLRLQRPTPTSPAQGTTMALDLATPDTTGSGTAQPSAAVATNRARLAVSLVTPSTSRVDTGIERPALDTRQSSVSDFSAVGTSKLDMLVSSVFPDPDKLGRARVSTGRAKANTATRAVPVNWAALHPVKPGTARSDTAVVCARANTIKLDVAADSAALDRTRLGPSRAWVIPVTPNPATGDFATEPLMPNRSTDQALDHTAAVAATLDPDREVKGLTETRTDAAMSELVPEPRPKPAVPMKPVSINSSLLGYIGIDTIIEQMRKKTMKTGFDFNIMVVGQSGLGKSTLVNTLFKSQVSRKASSWAREEKIPKTVEIKAIGHVIEEGGVKMKLTVIDTPGFGDQINNENCWEPIEKYINEQYEKFLKEEVNIARKKRIPDTRVHCCLYFISPTGHSLRPLDLEFMKHLSKVVNIIPVIAKADTMTLEEKSEFKQRVRKELEAHGIEFYPQREFDEDLEDKAENDKIRESMPFAVVGSDKEYQVNGKRVLGRKTPWGVIEVENLSHCEFALLRDFVIRTHLQDLKEVTHNIHYETYRAKRLNDNGGLPPGEGLLGTVLPPVPATPCPSAE